MLRSVTKVKRTSIEAAEVAVVDRKAGVGSADGRIQHANGGKYFGRIGL
jgi:hypothetical protein